VPFREVPCRTPGRRSSQPPASFIGSKPWGSERTSTTKAGFVLGTLEQVLFAARWAAFPSKPDEFTFVLHAVPCLIRIDDHSVPVA
jgi:hypothetical protein